MKKSVLLFICLIITVAVPAQLDTIFLENPSFEDIPRQGKVPKGWTDFGFPNETTVDIHPSNIMGVIDTAYHGNTYVGMVVRDNNTWERIGQKLKTPIPTGKCYTFSLWLYKAPDMISISRKTSQKAPYNLPVVLRVWSAQKNGDLVELLDESKSVINTEWVEYTFEFQPKQNVEWVIFEAYPTNSLAYNGNIQLDNMSPITSFTCGESIPAELPSTEANANLPVRKFDLPETEQDMINILMEYGPKVSFDQEDKLIVENYQTENKEQHTQNPDLHQIAAAAKSFSKAFIIIAVLGDSEFQRERRSFEVKNALQSLNCSEGTIVVRPYREADKDRSWLWPESSGSSFLVRYLSK